MKSISEKKDDTNEKPMINDSIPGSAGVINESAEMEILNKIKCFLLLKSIVN